MPRRDDEFTPDPFENDFLEKDPTETDLKDPTDQIDLSDDFYDHEHEACPVEDPRAAEWQEHTFEHNDDIEVPTWAQYQIFELARFRVPPGQQGRVSVLETAILAINLSTSQQLANRAPEYPSYYTYYFGALWPTDRDIAIRFYLRLESWKRDDLPGAARTFATRNDLPGVAYPPLGQWADTRYDFMRQSHPSLLISEGHYLTLWCEFVGSDVRRIVNVWGRLGGVTQAYHNNPQAINSAREWPQNS